MTNTEHIAQAKAALAAIELSEKCRAFLEKAFDVLETKPIAGIEVNKTFRGAKFVVYYEDGDFREYEAQAPKPKE